MDQRDLELAVRRLMDRGELNDHEFSVLASLTLVDFFQVVQELVYPLNSKVMASGAYLHFLEMYSARRDEFAHLAEVKD